jgi:hypothetical protein
VDKDGHRRLVVNLKLTLENGIIPPCGVAKRNQKPGPSGFISPTFVLKHGEESSLAWTIDGETLVAYDGTRDLKLLEHVQSLKFREFMKATLESREATKDTVKELCDLFSSADSAERAEIISHIQNDFSFLFFWFARAMAEKAVQQSIPEAIWDGLLALVLENFTFDYRDSLHRLVLLYHSATKLGLDVEALFARAGTLSMNPMVTKLVRGFPLRSPGGRTLGSFLFEESGAGDSFRYRKLGYEEFHF